MRAENGEVVEAIPPPAEEMMSALTPPPAVGGRRGCLANVSWNDVTSDEAEPVNEPAVDGRNDGVEADLLDGERDSDAGESTETVRGVVGDWRIAPSEAIVGVWKAGVMRDAGRGGRGVVGEVTGVGGRRVAGEDESWPRVFILAVGAGTPFM